MVTLGRNFWIVAGGAVMLGGCVATVSPISAVALVGVGSWFGWIAWDTRRRMPGISLVNQSSERVGSGDLAGARRLLDSVDVNRMNRATRRAFELNRATLALLAGDAKGSVAHATLAIDGKTQLFTKTHEQAQIANALAHRAVSYAVLGEREMARADAETVRVHAGVMPSALARATLADAIVLAATGRRDSLRDLVTAHGRLLRDYLLPRERVLARSLARLARADKTTVYREPGKSGEAVDPVAEWASATAEHADSEVWAPLPTTERAMYEAQQVRERMQRHVPKKSRVGATLLLWVLLIVIFLVIWSFLQPSSGGPPAESMPERASLFAGMIVGPLLVGLVALSTWRGSRRGTKQTMAFRQAALAEARGHREQARAAHEALAAARAPLAVADLELAKLADEEGRFKDALELSERGLGKIATLMARALAHDVLAPALSAERSFCLSMLGRTDEANAELATLVNHPNYPASSVAQLRVRLAQALFSNDRKAAFVIARRRGPNMPINGRDEMVCDLLDATEGGGVDPIEWARLDADLNDDAELLAYVNRLLPGVRARLVPRARITEALEPEEADEPNAEETTARV